MSSARSAPDTQDDPASPVSLLLADGFDVVLQHGHLVVRRIPYVSPDGVREDGMLAFPVNDTGGVVIDVTGNHTIFFVGDEPRDERGNPLGGQLIPGRDIGKGQTAGWVMSFKPASGHYAGPYEKVCSYARIVGNPAQHLDATVTATPGAAFQVVEDGLPFVYRDTNTTRAGMTALNNVFRGHTVVIVGLGGTGSYILDQVAKTWVDRILLIDGDIFENHNAFRAPGAASLEALQAGRNKAEYFAEEYSRMRTGITPHPEALTMENIDVLEGATFVFLAAADANERPAIMAWLRQRDVPFVDVGMGLRHTQAGLTGLLKTTAYLPGNNIELPDAPATPAPDDDYASNIQVADLNALNALLAVVRWKRLLGYYATHSISDETVFKVFLNEIRNGATVDDATVEVAAGDRAAAVNGATAESGSAVNGVLG